MKWILVAILIGLLVTRARHFGALGTAVKSLPKRYREGKAHAADPASAAKPVPTVEERKDPTR